jgi:hypothetical protein
MRARRPDPNFFFLVGDGAGFYSIEINLMHGTQRWEERFDNGNLALNCFEIASCTLTASPSTGVENAVDDSGSSFYTSATGPWQVEFHDPTFIGLVYLKPNVASDLDQSVVEVSEDGISGWFQYPIGTFPSSAAYLEIPINQPKRFLRIRKNPPAPMSLADVQVFGY